MISLKPKDTIVQNLKDAGSVKQGSYIGKENQLFRLSDLSDRKIKA